MTPEEMLQIISTSMAYNHDSEEEGFEILTRTRYRDIKSISNMYVCTHDGLKIFKLTIEEVKITDLPDNELQTLNDHLEHLDYLESEEDEDE